MIPRLFVFLPVLLLGLVCTAVLLAAQSPVQADAGIQLIPQPVRVERRTGCFVIRHDTAIVFPAGARAEAEGLRDDLEAVTAEELALVPASTRKCSARATRRCTPSSRR